MLGTGTPVPSPSQYGASTLIEAGGLALLFDCGRGCSIRLAQTRRQLISQVDEVFLTHLHSDHVVGLPDLWLNGWTQGRSRPLKISGPVGTADLMAGLASAFAFDTRLRGDVERVPASTTGLETDIAEFSGDGIVFQENGVTVTAFLVDHAAIKPAYGFRIDYAGASVLISGDTKETPNLLKYGALVDVFILDVMSPKMIEIIGKRRTPREAKIIIGHHLSAPQAAIILAATKPRLAIYTHTINGPDFTPGLLAKTGEGYDGTVVVAVDLMEIDIGDEVVVRRPQNSAGN